ncbi:MAG: metalloregulator ArsR/SmtB family transcription factor [Candidatus Marinimicrobia bacterium]|nr:metalloregulator ArsR/SmtB family transcription factor [Candidatus Neomarinimicrobiota bacterium]
MLNNVFFALSDPTRRGILKRVARKPLSVNEIAEPYEMSLAAVSKHIQVLERAELISKEKQGRSYSCRMNFSSLEDASKLIQEYRQFWTKRLDSLEEYLDNQQQGKEKQ